MALCNDARFNGVYLALHRYAFPYGSRTYDQWVTDLTTLIGNCADRTVIEEFGASADTGVDFDRPEHAGRRQRAHQAGDHSLCGNCACTRVPGDRPGDVPQDTPRPGQARTGAPKGEQFQSCRGCDLPAGYAHGDPSA